MRIGVMMRHMGEKGGINVYSRNILESMLRLKTNHEFVLFLAGAESKGKYKDVPGVTESVIESSNRLLWDQYLLPKHLKREGVDLVFNPKLSVPLMAPCKTVLTMHGLEQFAARRLFRWHDRLYFQTAMPFFCRRADAIISMTETGKRDLKKYLDVPPDKVHVIPESYNERCAVVTDAQQLQRIREKYKLPENFVLFVGGVTPLKNIPTLIRACHALKQKKFPHALVLAGFRRWKFEKDLAVIDDLGMRSEVVELGFVDDDELPAIYSMAACFVLPSFYEGFGIPILEAQACGCPVIVSTGGAMTEVAGGAALSFDPNRADELAARLESVLTDNNLRERLKKQGLENVKKYRWETTARKTLAMFEEVIRAK